MVQYQLYIMLHLILTLHHAKIKLLIIFTICNNILSVSVAFGEKNESKWKLKA